MLEINDSNFKEVLRRTQGTVLLYFRAAYCGPSAFVDPMIDQLIDEYDGRLHFADIDIEKEPRVAMSVALKGTPTIVMVRENKPIGSIMGTMTYKDLVEFVEKHLT